MQNKIEHDKIAFGDSIIKQQKGITQKFPLKYNKPCEEDYCYNNMGQRCSDCIFTGKGKYEQKRFRNKTTIQTANK